MKIGIVTTSFPRWHGDFSGNFVLGFAESLAKLGHTINVLAPEPAESIEPPTWPGITLHWVPYVRPRTWSKTFYSAGIPDNLASNPRAALGIPLFLANLARVTQAYSKHWDALVTHWAFPNALITALVTSLPHLAVFHSSDIFFLRKVPGSHVWAERIANQSTSLLFVAQHLRDAFLELLPSEAKEKTISKTHVHPMGIHPSHASNKNVDHTRPITLLFLGRLVPIKGIDIAIRAIANTSFELIIAGTGPEEPTLRALASSCNARVHFVGHLQAEEKQRCFQRCDAIVVPSRTTLTGRTEGTPTVILEAMEAGIPVIATRTGGIPNLIIDQHTGLLIPENNPNALLQAVRTLSTNVALRTQLQRNAKTASQPYLWCNLGPRFEKLIKGEHVVFEEAPAFETFAQAHLD